MLHQPSFKLNTSLKRRSSQNGNHEKSSKVYNLSGLLVYQNRTKSKRKLKSQLLKYNITQLIHLRASLEKKSNQENIKAKKLKKYQRTIQLESENPEDVRVIKTKNILFKSMWNMMTGNNKFSYLTALPYAALLYGSSNLGFSTGILGGNLILAKIIKDRFYKELSGNDSLENISKTYQKHTRHTTDTEIKKIKKLVYEEAIQNQLRNMKIDVTSYEHVKTALNNDNINDEELVKKIVKKKIKYDIFSDKYTSKNGFAGHAAITGIAGFGTQKLNQYAKDLREKRIEQFMEAERELRNTAQQ